MTEPETWWRGGSPPESYDGGGTHGVVLTGGVTAEDVLAAPTSGSGLKGVRLFRSRLDGEELDLSDLHLHVRWSELEDCTLRQRTRPVLNDHGIAAQGSLGAVPSIYRRCTFERVRFKNRGGFGLGQARFEGCRFVACRWEGSFAHSADLVGCVFTGRMNGCVWFGRDRAHERVNEVRDNDFTGVEFTDNVGWRADFPFAQQSWPTGYLPSRGD